MVSKPKTGAHRPQVLEVYGAGWSVAAGGLVAYRTRVVSESDWGTGGVGGVLPGQFHAVQIRYEPIVIIHPDAQVLGWIDRRGNGKSLSNEHRRVSVEHVAQRRVLVRDAGVTVAETAIAGGPGGVQTGVGNRLPI